MKKIIEKIKEIKGVERVEEIGCNELAVRVKKERAVECTNKEQLAFAFEKKFKLKYKKSDERGCVYLDHDGWDLKEDAERNAELIPFSQYLSDYNLTDEWKKYLIGEAKAKYNIGQIIKSIGRPAEFTLCRIEMAREFDSRVVGINNEEFRRFIYKDGKWATIIETEVELVSGEIYFRKTEDFLYLIRSDKHNKDHNTISYYSFLNSNKRFKTADYVDFASKFEQATDKQKAKLMKTELENGYLWNGKELVKYK